MKTQFTNNDNQSMKIYLPSEWEIAPLVNPKHENAQLEGTEKSYSRTSVIGNGVSLDAVGSCQGNGSRGRRTSYQSQPEAVSEPRLLFLPDSMFWPVASNIAEGLSSACLSTGAILKC